MRYIIRNVSIFDGSGSPLVAGTVVAEGERIAAVLRAGEAISDQDLLREVMNTVGRKGQLGEQIRCVV